MKTNFSSYSKAEVRVKNKEVRVFTAFMIEKNIVKHVAHLARIKMTEEEIATFTKELGSVLEYVVKLEEVDVSGVEPIAHITGIENAMREDGGELPPESNHDLLEEQAPGHTEGEIRVPRIIE